MKQPQINTKGKVLKCPGCGQNLFDVDVIEVCEEETTTTLNFFTNCMEQGTTSTEKEGIHYVKCRACNCKIDIHISDIRAHYENNEPIKVLHIIPEVPEDITDSTSIMFITSEILKFICKGCGIQITLTSRIPHECNCGRIYSTSISLLMEKP